MLELFHAIRPLIVKEQTELSSSQPLVFNYSDNQKTMEYEDDITANYFDVVSKQDTYCRITSLVKWSVYAAKLLFLMKPDSRIRCPISELSGFHCNN